MNWLNEPAWPSYGFVSTSVSASFICLLKLVARQANGYRSYPAEALIMLGLITSAQGAGFSLDEQRRARAGLEAAL
ncbi:MAG: hypothetical protein R3292_14940 [Alcanivorax sp.]|nr:hypothetical protein [Alcanivorax sp.]